MKFSSVLLTLGLGLAPLTLAAPVPAPAPGQSAHHGDEFTALVAGITPLNGGKAPTIPVLARSDAVAGLPTLIERRTPLGSESGGPGVAGRPAVLSQRILHIKTLKYSSGVPHRTPSSKDPRFFIFLAAVLMITATVAVAEVRSGFVTRMYDFMLKRSDEEEEGEPEVKAGLLDVSDDED
jgi:hypothetical protein